jgi:hypothetical protein
MPLAQPNPVPPGTFRNPADIRPGDLIRDWGCLRTITGTSEDHSLARLDFAPVDGQPGLPDHYSVGWDQPVFVRRP